eukprot:1373346-Amphidinium_carterae.1
MAQGEMLQSELEGSLAAGGRCMEQEREAQRSWDGEGPKVLTMARDVEQVGLRFEVQQNASQRRSSSALQGAKEAHLGQRDFDSHPTMKVDAGET